MITITVVNEGGVNGRRLRLTFSKSSVTGKNLLIQARYVKPGGHVMSMAEGRRYYNLAEPVTFEAAIDLLQKNMVILRKKLAGMTNRPYVLSGERG